MDCSLPGSSVHGDSPGQNTGMGCHALLRGIFPTWEWTQVIHTVVELFTVWATREAHMYMCVYMYLYIHIYTIFSDDGHLCCFHVLAIINSTAVNLGVHMSFQIMVFPGDICMPSSGIAGSYGNSVFSFWSNIHTVLYSGCTNLHSHQQYRTVPFSPRLLQRLLFVNRNLFRILTKQLFLPGQTGKSKKENRKWGDMFFCIHDISHLTQVLIIFFSLKEIFQN